MIRDTVTHTNKKTGKEFLNMDEQTRLLLEECSSGCKMAVNSLEQTSEFIKDSELLKLIGIKFPRLLRMIASVATVLLSIVAFIMLICLVAKANPDVENLDRVAHYALGAGSILILVFGVVGGAAGAIANRK